MSSNNLYRRTLAAITLVPLYTLLACASGAANKTIPPPQPMGDSASIANGEGKTIENMFAGRFPGVSVTSVEGGGLKIRIRGGANSFYSSEEPLYVLDDVPIQPGPGGIIFLNPYDIAKIEVLKNPEDVGLYGVRGGNGVIRITTKKPGK